MTEAPVFENEPTMNPRSKYLDLLLLLSRFKLKMNCACSAALYTSESMMDDKLGLVQYIELIRFILPFVTHL